MRSACAGLVALLLASWVVAATGQVTPQALAAEPALASHEHDAQAPDSSPGASRSAAPNRAVFAASSVGHAQRMPAQQREEWRFLKEAAASSRFEREAAQLALAKTGNANLRAWAAGLLDYHTTTGNELQLLLQQRGMAPPMMGNAHRHALKHLAKLRGAKFDREFVRQVAVRSQHEDVALFQRAAATARDVQIKAWVDAKLPAVQWSLESASSVAMPSARSLRTVRAVPVVMKARADRRIGNGADQRVR